MSSNSDYSFKLTQMYEAERHTVVEDFHEFTKIGKVPDYEMAKSVNIFLSSPPVRHLSARAWKEYPGYEKIALPEADLQPMSLSTALGARRSMANVAPASGARASIHDLSAILRFSYGVTGALEEAGPYPKLPLRASCSAGGLYPLEIYPIVVNMDGLASGVYHYSVMDHSLSVLRQERVEDCFPDWSTQQSVCRNASVILMISGVMRRTISKYKQRGYRFIMNDAGALCQSLCLTSTAMGLANTAWGGFCDDPVGEYIGIDNVDETMVLGFVIGSKYAVQD